jgi:hypothetical protein
MAQPTLKLSTRNRVSNSSLIVDWQMDSPLPVMSSSQAPALSREGIHWRSSATHVEIMIEVANRGSAPTEPARLVVEAAAFGAFVPGFSVARFAVPALGAGEKERVSFSVERSKLPATLLTGDVPVVRPGFDHVFAGREIDLVSSAEWIGNLNVWFDRHLESAVEVHRALGLKITARRPAGISVYLPPQDDYQIEVIHNGRGWTAEVVRCGATFPDRFKMPSISTLIVEAPYPNMQAKVALLVKRLSDGRIVPVDFSFESIEGPSERLGCIKV